MLFLNPSLLPGLVCVAIPAIVHLLNRRSAQCTDWGAMQFLSESIASRSRRSRLEDALLMAVRCLTIGLIVLALARPFSPPSSTLPHGIVLAAILLAITLFALAVALGHDKVLRGWLLLTSVSLLFLTGAAIFYENYLNLRRLSGAGGQDIAIIIDGSTSMTAAAGAGRQSNFQRAVDEARDMIHKSDERSAFSIILAGPSPVVKTPTPLSDRQELDRILEKLSPSAGQMRALDALSTARRTLETGSHEAKRVIVLTDRQRGGWETDNPAGWDALAEQIGAPSGKPQLLIRHLPPPLPFRNLAVTGIGFSREVIGTDREVEITVTLENTGSEAVTPSGLQLRIGSDTLNDQTLGQFPPGMRESVTFRHRFREAGAQVLTASCAVDDDLEQDNRFTTARQIIGQLNIMIVDGNPAPRFVDRGSSFIELALAPRMLTRQDYLLEPTIVPAPQIINVLSFDSYQAIILADVARLPEATASKIADYVRGGGGLLVAPGERSNAAFYNGWLTAPAEPFLPARMSGFFTAPPGSPAAATAPSLASFEHPALSTVADPDQSDLGTASLTAYWKLAKQASATAGSRFAAELDNGDPFVATRTFGAGTVFMTCCALDPSSGNLTTRESFLPFLQEIIYHIADPGGLQLNLDPGVDFTLPLNRATTPSGAGESGEDYATYTVTGPLGQLRDAQLRRIGKRIVATVGGGTMAGLYEMQIPPAAREGFPDLLTAAGTLPFTVIRPAEESRFDALTRADIEFMSRYLEVLEPESLEAALAMLAGQPHGRELWKFLAVGVLILLVMEIALTRWIATNRRTGHQETVQFPFGQLPAGRPLGLDTRPSAKNNPTRS